MTDDAERILAADLLDDADGAVEGTLRPRSLDEYVGQREVKANLSVLLEAARGEGEAADHVLLYGPPGLGKTTLATIIARELGVNVRYTSGPAIERPGDLAAILTALDERDVLFIDEIHRLNRAVEEILYPAMEDYALDVMIGKGPSARSPPADPQAVHGRRCDDPGRPDLIAARATGSGRPTGSTSTRRRTSPTIVERSAADPRRRDRAARRPSRSPGADGGRRGS